MESWARALAIDGVGAGSQTLVFAISEEPALWRDVRGTIIRQQGVTLMECLITLAVLAVLAAVAVPPLSDQLRAARAHAGAQQLYAATQYARSMAQTLSTGITVCPMSSTEPSVDLCGGHFGGPLVVYRESPSGPEILRIWSPPEGIEVRNRSGLYPVEGRIKWRGDGIGLRSLTLSVCAGSHNWAVVINRLGRPRLMKNGGSCPVRS